MFYSSFGHKHIEEHPAISWKMSLYTEITFHDKKTTRRWFYGEWFFDLFYPIKLKTVAMVAKISQF